MQHRLSSQFRIASVLAVVIVLGGTNGRGVTQTLALENPMAPLGTVAGFAPATRENQALPDSPGASRLHQTSQLMPEESESSSASQFFDGRTFDPPSRNSQFHAYLRDSHDQRAFSGSSGRAFFGTRGHSSQWGQDTPATQRIDSNLATGSNLSYSPESISSDDTGYIACHGCSVKRKFANAFFGEATPRNDFDEHRSFSSTSAPGIAGFSGSGHNSIGGIAGTRSMAAARVGRHLITEFVWERRHGDPKLGN
jgi:hypothetical protein